MSGGVAAPAATPLQAQGRPALGPGTVAFTGSEAELDTAMRGKAHGLRQRSAEPQLVGSPQIVSGSAAATALRPVTADWAEKCCSAGLATTASHGAGWRPGSARASAALGPPLGPTGQRQQRPASASAASPAYCPPAAPPRRQRPPQLRLLSLGLGGGTVRGLDAVQRALADQVWLRAGQH
jgi:hypothetical protein